MHEVVASKQKEIAEICRRHDVRSLEVFGSAARADDFDETHSDVDFLVTYRQSKKPNALSQFFGLRDELRDILGREVDLIEPGAVRNPFVMAEIQRHRESVFVG